jgi:hypothetical protein
VLRSKHRSFMDSATFFKREACWSCASRTILADWDFPLRVWAKILTGKCHGTGGCNHHTLQTSGTVRYTTSMSFPW